MSEKWYAMRIKPHKERAVAKQLETREAIYYLPTIKVKPVNPRSAKEKPYFPGYLFVKADLEALGHNAFSWLPGTFGLVTFGETATAVPDALIHELQEKLSRLSEKQERKLDIKKGERVKIQSGPFAGYEAIFDMQLPGSERVQVLLAFLSKYPQTVKLNSSDIAKPD